MSAQPISNRHDILILFEVTNGNPNGDPDSGNQPRVDASNNRGLISDVCLKRKVRNYVQMFAPPANGKDFKILVQQGAVIDRNLNEAVEKTKGEVKEKDKDKNKGDHARLAKDWICTQYYDVRAFGGVLSVGNEIMKGSTYGQVRGPVQFTFGRSFHAIAPQEITITRCAVTKESDASKERTMGQKHIVPYALYAAKCYVSPAFAEATGFDQGDFDLLIEAMSNLFEHDRSAARGDMVVRGLYDFEHVGTQGKTNPEQNRREARLGCAHAHHLFESIRVAPDATRFGEVKHGDGFQPSEFDDYQVTVDHFGPDGISSKFPGVVLHRRVDAVR